MVRIVNPANGNPLEESDGHLVDKGGQRFPIVRGIPRFSATDNYAANFGEQWNRHRTIQIDRPETGRTASEKRFFATTGWSVEQLEGRNVLEVGSGAGRFSRVILQRTGANLYSIDYSTAVDANMLNNGAIAPARFHLFQASIYEMPFPDDSFDKVFCMGVLQHTPDFEKSVAALVSKAKSGGEIVVDFYPIRGFWTKIHAKYLLRPLTRRMSNDRLLRLIDRNVDSMIALSRFLHRNRLGVLARFVPICDIQRTMPAELSPDEFREWVVLDTFDMFSPAFDNPQPIEAVAAMFRRAGARVEFADFVSIDNMSAAVVRAIKA